MLTKQPLITIHKREKGCGLSFNKEALEMINTKSICIFYSKEGIIIKKPTIDNNHVSKIYNSNTCYFACGDNENIIGKYEVYRKDEDTFLLVKLN